jgi:tol-pal system protein YbgF
MSKQVLLGLTCAAALMAMPLLYANDAPVVDVTQQAQPQAAKPDDSNLTPSDDSSQTPLVTSVTPSNPPADSAPNDDNASPNAARLEQQVRNLIRMNLPDQITQLRQQVEKLRGQIQVQAHTIETLKQRLAQKQAENKDQKPVEDVKENQDKNPDQKSVPPVKADDSAAAPAQTTDQAPTPPSVTKSSDEAGAYRNAFNMLIKKQYAPAGEAFESYLKQYPNGQFLVNAHYWLGEIYLLQKKSSLALEQFQAVVDQFPHSSKVSDSKLKIAQILAQTGKVKEARVLLTTIIKKYPGSTAAQLAKIQLQQLNPPKKSREE